MSPPILPIYGGVLADPLPTKTRKLRNAALWDRFIALCDHFNLDSTPLRAAGTVSTDAQIKSVFARLALYLAFAHVPGFQQETSKRSPGRSKVNDTAERQQDRNSLRLLFEAKRLKRPEDTPTEILKSLRRHPDLPASFRKRTKRSEPSVSLLSGEYKLALREHAEQERSARKIALLVEVLVGKPAFSFGGLMRPGGEP